MAQMKSTDQGRPIIEMRGISKSFKDVKALTDVDFCIQKGEIRAIIGENGAGKSTLMKILYGMYGCDQGEIRVKGEPIPNHWTPAEAIRMGIGMIHQHLSSVPVYNILENVMLPTLKWNMFNDRWRDAADKIEQIIREYHFEVSLEDRFSDISIGQKQQVEIIKVLYQGVDILILDEPTSVLTPKQAEVLLDLLLRLRDDGISIVVVTHKLEEAMHICDSITVIRRGHHIATVKRDETDIQQLARLMIDRDYYSEKEPPVSLEQCTPMMGISNLNMKGDDASIGLVDISFNVNRGEILGVAGVAGNGQNELAEVLIGLRQGDGGSIVLDGEEISQLSIAGRIKAGIGYIPEDRHNVGLILPMNIAENLVLHRIDSEEFSKSQIMRRNNIKSFSEEVIRDFDVKTRDERTLTEQLSGGNQQKVILGRVLKSDPKVVVACQPTWGLDFGATEYIRDELRKVADHGAGVLLISNDLDEILELANRIIVMYRGRIVGSMAREDVDMDVLGLMMIGRSISESEAV